MLDENDLLAIDALFQKRFGETEEHLTSYIDKRIEETEERLTSYIDKRIEETEKRLTSYVDKRIEETEKRLTNYVDKRIEESEKRLTNYVDKRIEETEKRLTSYVDERVAEAAQQINKNTVMLMDLEFKPRFDLLSDGLQEIRSKLIPVSRIEKLEDEVQVLKLAVRQINEDIQALKKAN